MDAIQVPEVTQLPELSGCDEDPVRFADMLLTSLLGADSALLHAECVQREGGDSSVSWYIRPREQSGDGPDIEIGASPSLGSFRAVLARFGRHYLGDQLYNGYARKFLEQRGRILQCHIYMSNASQSGFWIRIYSTLSGSPTTTLRTIDKRALP